MKFAKIPNTPSVLNNLSPRQERGILYRNEKRSPKGDLLVKHNCNEPGKNPMLIENRIKVENCVGRNSRNLCKLELLGGSSPRSISIDQLNALLHLHLRPIKLVVCK